MSVSLGVQNLPIFGQKCSPPKMNRYGGKIPSHLFDTFPVLHLFPTFPFRFTLVHHYFLLQKHLIATFPLFLEKEMRTDKEM